MMKEVPEQPDPKSLSQLSKEELVSVIIEQASLSREQQLFIEQLRQDIERLKVSRDLDSKTSSKPPASDLLKKPEKKKPQLETDADSPQRNPGGQPGHPGKTRPRR